jgi:branched-chain amino acid transport system ATP-binding protein
LILELQHITFAFRGKNYLLDNVSLSLKTGNIYALMGSNGSGKTTLFNLITGFLNPLKGEIIFRDEKITSFAPYEINRKGIGRTFQNMRLITKQTVKENIILSMKGNPTDRYFNALLPRFIYKHVIRQLNNKADKLIEQFFLTEIYNKPAGEISYGQQKLLSIACCVANDAELILLDEPVAGINPEFKNKISLVLKQLQADGKTILLIEHNTDFLEQITDQFFFLHEGRITEFENLELLRKDKQVMGAYI